MDNYEKTFKEIRTCRNGCNKKNVKRSKKRNRISNKRLKETMRIEGRITDDIEKKQLRCGHLRKDYPNEHASKYN